MRKMMKFAGTVMAFLSLGGCSGVDLLNSLARQDGVIVDRNLAYEPGAGHGVDVYRPADAVSAPTIVFFFGGSWQEGRKEDYAFLGRALARRGFVVAIPDYRLYPDVKFAGFMEDGAAATAWAASEARRFGGDPHRLVLMGHSAGALIAALLTLDDRWLARRGVDPNRDVAGTVGLAGPYDFLPIEDPVLQIIFGPPARLADTQAINFAKGSAPPMLLATDAGDTTVRPRNTERLVEAIRRAGGRVETRTYTGVDHRLLIGAVSDPLSFLAPVLGDVTAFIRGLKPTEARSAAR